MQITRPLCGIALLAAIRPAAAEEPTAEPEEEPGLLRRYVDQILDDEAEPGKTQFLIYPVVAVSPETRVELGLSSLLVFTARQDPANRLSEVPVYVFYTLNNQYGLWLDHAIFSDQNRLSFLGENRLQDFPLKYFGIGIGATDDDAVLVDARQVLLRERVLVRLAETDLYLGPEAGFNALRDVQFEALEDGIAPPAALPLGGDGTTNLTLGGGIVYDTRHNPLNVREGAFGELALLRSSDAFVSDYTFTNVFVDLRAYKPVREHHVLAAQAVGQFGAGDLPFNELGLIGGETIMRGYYAGRYRDRNLLAAQVEMRFLPIPLGFTSRIGAAVFLASGGVYPSWDALSLSSFRVTGGAGLRVLTFPKSDIFTRLDVGLSEDGPGIYIYVGEAF